MENSKPKTIVAFGEVLWDLFPAGPVLGGAPLNFAYRINSFGYRGVMISQLGQDALGAQALKQMQALHMDTAFIQRTADYPTGTVEITLDETKSPIFTIIPNVAYDYIRHTADMDELVRTAACLCFGTVAQRAETSRATLSRLLDAFTGQYALYDINLRKDCYTAEVVTASIARAHILKLNEHEMPIVAQMYGLPDDSLPQFAARLFRKTRLQYCLVTLGERGAFAAANTGETVSTPAYRVNLVDTCGSGDAFTAGFLYALLENKGLPQACQFGNALGAMVAEQPGATQPVPLAELERFLRTRAPFDVT